MCTPIGVFSDHLWSTIFLQETYRSHKTLFKFNGVRIVPAPFGIVGTLTGTFDILGNMRTGKIVNVDLSKSLVCISNGVSTKKLPVYYV